MKKNAYLKVEIFSPGEYSGPQEFVELLREIADDLDTKHHDDIVDAFSTRGDDGVVQFWFQRYCAGLNGQVTGGNILSLFGNLHKMPE